MKYFFLVLILLGTISFGLSVPTSADAGLVVCGLNADDASTANNDESKPCTACHLILMGNTIMEWMMRVMTVIGFAVIFAMGVLYIVSAGNDKLMGTAKGGIKAALIGFAIILAAWLIINTTIRIFGASGYFGTYFTQQGAFTFTCDTTSNAGTARSSTFGNGGGILVGTGKVPPGGSGTCTPITSPGNPCSVANLEKTCWGVLGLAETASAVCNMESNGIPTKASGTDHCGKGGPSVSHGLFQINITANKNAGCVGMANPPLAHVQQHSDGWYDATCKVVVPMSQVQACITKTQDAAWNIQEACNLYKSGGWNPWPLTKQKCKI